MHTCCHIPFIFACPSFPAHYGIIKPTLQITISYYPFTFFSIWQTHQKKFFILHPTKKKFFFSSFSLYHFSLLFRFITADSHVFLVRPLSVTLFFSFLLVAKQILRLSFHSFVFNRTMRRWISWFSSLLSVSLITVLRWGEIIYSRFSFATIGGI